MALEDELLKIANVVGGGGCAKIVKSLRRLGSATDNELSSGTSIELKEVRKILYKLHNLSLVDVKRVRNEKSGWFVFYWRLQPDAVEGFIQSKKRTVLEKLSARLKYEESHDFYVCIIPECRSRIPFEEAVELIFRCPNCGKALEYADNRPVVDALRERIYMIKRELEG